ncbi:hypothetical protein TVAG_393970 [Trichomonas vaginalis G3]|uniref:Sec1 family protein n=1 Tax=Trichomonas vaginalis (strain ATCC PRA-98 / G3) TaxID=412133 RepID=A2DWB4_TRIV3|nr:Sec1/munc18-like (SM) proteins family [Trichomonas vaginalis G3]EAY15254.1 hypothetical protein TVAG_393970 [Trichomonas vaginalis G3]KAI5526442.1 Sec1/munc18-like (SM) proteins family [Trichomonas vaginalis G3]|eukprot:XP_001327477.1 hypothetical protein [Trichomonas vaginalis G3]
MTYSPLSSKNVQNGTILFVDNFAAEAIALTGGIKSVVPKVYLSIISIDKHPKEITSLIQRMTEIAPGEHFEIFIGSLISNYRTQITQIASIEEYDITRIYTTNINETGQCLPEKLRNRIEIIPDFYVELVKNISISTTIKTNILEQFAQFDETQAPNIINLITRYLKNNGSPQVKCYSIGNFAGEIAGDFEKKRQGNPNSALLVIDRCYYSAPLFADTDSLLDTFAKTSLFQTIYDKDLLNLELTKGPKELLTYIQQLVGSKEPTYDSICVAWSKLDDPKKNEIQSKHKIIAQVFENFKTSNKKQLQEMLFNGEEIDDVLDSAASLKESLDVIGVKRMFSTQLDLESLVQKAFSQNRSDAKNFCSPQNAVSILTECRSGFDRNSSPSLKSIFTLTNLIKSLYNNNGEDDPRIKCAGTGMLSGFLNRTKPPTIGSFNEIFVVILGGLSFQEVYELGQLLSASNQKKIHILTDTICSTINIFSNKEQ